MILYYRTQRNPCLLFGLFLITWVFLATYMHLFLRALSRLLNWSHCLWEQYGRVDTDIFSWVSKDDVTFQTNERFRFHCICPCSEYVEQNCNQFELQLLSRLMISLSIMSSFEKCLCLVMVSYVKGIKSTALIYKGKH